jgi:hypothetical protein
VIELLKEKKEKGGSDNLSWFDLTVYVYSRKPLTATNLLHDFVYYNEAIVDGPTIDLLKKKKKKPS